MSDTPVESAFEPLYELVLERHLPLDEATDVAERIAARSRLPAEKVAKLLTKSEGAVITKPTEGETLARVESIFLDAGAEVRLRRSRPPSDPGPTGPKGEAGPGASPAPTAVGSVDAAVERGDTTPMAVAPSEGRLRRPKGGPKYYGGSPVTAPGPSRWHTTFAVLLMIGSFAALVSVFLPFVAADGGTTSFLGGAGSGPGWVIVLVIGGLFSGLFRRRWLGVTLFALALAIVLVDYAAVWGTVRGSVAQGLVDIAPTRLPEIAANAGDARLSPGWTVMVTALAVSILSCIGIPRRV